MNLMRFSAGWLVVLGAAFLPAAVHAQVPETPALAAPATPATPAAVALGLESDAQKMSYLIGQSVGGNIRPLAADIDHDAFRLGLKAALKGEESVIAPDEAQKIMHAAQVKMQQTRIQEAMIASSKAQAEGNAYRKANEAREGVVITASGLQYERLQAAKNPKAKRPKAQDTVRVHYRGTLIDGREFDSSIARNQPAKFPLSGVIEGWREGVQRMQVGEKARLVLPANLGYGEKGSGPLIGPGATLVFEVELLEIVKP